MQYESSIKGAWSWPALLYHVCLYFSRGCVHFKTRMKLQVSDLFAVLLLTCDGVRGEQLPCVQAFSELERSLIERESNIESMSDAFYPPNRQASDAANVYYFFNDGNEYQNLDLGSYNYAFRWSTSPVLESFDLNCCSIYHSLCIKDRPQLQRLFLTHCVRPCHYRQNSLMRRHAVKRQTQPTLYKFSTN